jgi:hypothetical protein
VADGAWVSGAAFPVVNAGLMLVRRRPHHAPSAIPNCATAAWDASSNAWTRRPSAPTPIDADQTAVVWNGRELLVWGIATNNDTRVATGGVEFTAPSCRRPRHRPHQQVPIDTPCSMSVPAKGHAANPDAWGRAMDTVVIVTELLGIAAVLLGVRRAVRLFQGLHDALPGALEPSGPLVEPFEGFDGTGGAGVSVYVRAQHPDGRGLFWQVELWIDRQGGDRDGEWYGTVKAEIDLDDDDGNDHCVVNEQRGFNSSVEAATAIREMTDVVCSHPLEALLALRWTPDDLDDPGDEDDSPIGVVWTRTEIRVHGPGAGGEAVDPSAGRANDESSPNDLH